MKNKFLGIVTHPLFISLILSSILLYITHPLFPKYKTDLITKEKVNSTLFIYYNDLNNDGFSEEISLDKSYDNKLSIIIKTKGSIIDQWIFDGELNMPKLYFGDFNNDGSIEIFLFTLNGNDILLNCFNPFKKIKYVSDRLIDKFYPKNNEKTSGLTFCELNDLNEDGVKELVFAYTAGYSISPRKIYSYNILNDSLSKSDNGCISFYNTINFSTNKNSSIYFVPSNYAVGNCDSNLIYSDHFTWLTLLDNNLKFVFDPIKIGNYPSDLIVAPIRSNTILSLMALNIYQGNNNNKSSIGLYDLNGNKIKEKDIPNPSDWISAKFLINDSTFEKLFLIKRSGSIEEIKANLTNKRINKILPFDELDLNTIDADLNNLEEYIIHHRKQEKITIISNDFIDKVILDVTGNTQFYNAGIILNGKERPQLNLRFDNYSYNYEYYKNPFYNFRFMFYILIYFGIFGFLFVLQKSQNYRIEQKYRAQKEIAELQMKSIKNQMDPHFTLNIINSIGSLFAKQETDKANYIFGKYSKLLRQTILSSDQILTTLDEELEYVENYLTLEQFRIKDGFDYKMDIDDGIHRKVKIPKMLIHSFIENSVKHGIRHLDERGNITVSVTKKDKNYNIIIMDNGIGREKAKELSTFSTGKGLEIVDQIIELYYSLEKVKISYNITDLKNGNKEPLGTEIQINIPILT